MYTETGFEIQQTMTSAVLQYTYVLIATNVHLIYVDNNSTMTKSAKGKKTDADTQQTTISPTLDSGVKSPFPGDMHLRRM